jgi:redox-sensitive bicupin YhaK (pirin superfamily)
MGTVRKIKKILKSKPTLEGAGVHLKRVFGYQHVPMFDPFLLLDDFHSNNPDEYINGFPWHPHRGIETITYVIHGTVEHGDSLGNSGVIRSGDVQWMTAGSGIIHQEMPKGQKDGLMWGFQLWANLPASHKMMAPRYRDILSDTIPEIENNNGVIIKIISGEMNNRKGPVQDVVIDPEFFDIIIPPEINFVHKIKKKHTVFAYVIEGQGYFEQERDPYHYEIEGENYFDFKRECLQGPENLVFFNEGDEVSISASDKGVRFLLISGKPIEEPVAWYGPVVMNTQEELKIAFEEYHQGTFLKHQK